VLRAVLANVSVCSTFLECSDAFSALKQAFDGVSIVSRRFYNDLFVLSQCAANDVLCITTRQTIANDTFAQLSYLRAAKSFGVDLTDWQGGS
jgi:hypothetical protein